MLECIGFEEFEEVMKRLEGQFVSTLFIGNIHQVRTFNNFECANHIEKTGYFLGSQDDEDLDITIEKDRIDTILRFINDYEPEKQDMEEISIAFKNGDLFKISCYSEGGYQQ